MTALVVHSGRGDSMARDKAAYDMQYAVDHITKKVVDFNDRNEDDAAIMKWLSEHKVKFAPYVKRLILEDIELMKTQK